MYFLIIRCSFNALFLFLALVSVSFYTALNNRSDVEKFICYVEKAAITVTVRTNEQEFPAEKMLWGFLYFLLSDLSPEFPDVESFGYGVMLATLSNVIIFD